MRAWPGLMLVTLLTLTAVQDRDEPTNSLPAKNLLAKADQIVLFSLDPGPKGERRDDPKAKQLLHGWPVLGSLTVSDPAVQKKLVAALEKAAADSHEFEMALCFHPRHALQ